MNSSKILSIISNLDHSGDYKNADKLFYKFILSQASSYPYMSINDFKKMIYDSVKEASDAKKNGKLLFPNNEINTNSSIIKPGQPGFDLSTYKETAREIMLSALKANPLFEKISEPEHQQLIEDYISSFAKTESNNYNVDEIKDLHSLIDRIFLDKNNQNFESCKQGQNGNISDTFLRQVDPNGAKLRQDAAAYYTKMVAAAALEGVTISLMGPNSGYRTLDKQEEIFKTARPGYAATPGNSNHGYGVAIDVKNCNNTDTTVFKWLFKNAKNFNFRWCEKSQEAWHWTYSSCCFESGRPPRD